MILKLNNIMVVTAHRRKTLSLPKPSKPMNHVLFQNKISFQGIHNVLNIKRG